MDDGIEEIKTADGTWKNRERSNLILWLLSKSNVDRAHLAEYLGTSLNYFSNKLYRNAFSIEDLVTAADVCGFNLLLESRSDHSKYKLSPAYFGLDRIIKIKRSEYVKLKARCEALEDDLNRFFDAGYEQARLDFTPEDCKEKE